MPTSTRQPDQRLLAQRTPQAQRGSVLLLHGHGRTGVSMLFLAHALQKAGYETLAPSYGYRRSMEGILTYLQPRIDALQAAHPGPFHIVTHSLGGLVARALIARKRPAGLHRVVMLAPPNAGSEVAELLCRHGLDAALLGPVGRQLRTNRLARDMRILGGVDFELGVIAGDRPLMPLPSGLLPRPHDGLVTVAATRIEGMTAHIVLPVDHTRMVLDRRVIAATLAFLQTGAFHRQRGSQQAPAG